MNYYLLSLLYMMLCITTKAQVILPKIDYDQVKVTKSETIYKKEYFKEGKLIVEVFYPASKYKMEDHCGLCPYISYDSSYFYYVPTIIQCNFSNINGIEIVKWNGRLKDVSAYYPNGNLRFHNKIIVDPNFLSKDPIRCGSESYYVDEFIRFKDNGDTSSYGNYTTDAHNLKPSYSTSKKISSLQLKANELLKKNLGEEFFAKYVRMNYLKTNIHWDYNLIRKMNIPINGHALPPDSTILDVSFSYIIYFNQSEQYNLIHVHFDKNENLVFIEKDIKNSLTDGLLSNKAVSLLNSTQALQIAKPITKDKTEVYINLIWNDGDIVDGIGFYYYQILFNKTTAINSPDVTYDRLLINATTKEMSEVKKYFIKDCYGSKEELEMNLPK